MFFFGGGGVFNRSTDHLHTTVLHTVCGGGGDAGNAQNHGTDQREHDCNLFGRMLPGCIATEQTMATFQLCCSDG